jgi:hypothetical protein
VWLKEEGYDKIDAKVVKVNEKKIIAETVLNSSLGYLDSHP